VTPSVTALGDNNLGDATEHYVLWCSVSPSVRPSVCQQ